MRVIVLGFGLLGVETARLVRDIGHFCDLADKRSAEPIRSQIRKLKRHQIDYYASGAIPPFRYDLRIIACTSACATPVRAARTTTAIEYALENKGNPFADRLARIYEIVKDDMDMLGDHAFYLKIEPSKITPIKHRITAA